MAGTSHVVALEYTPDFREPLWERGGCHNQPTMCTAQIHRIAQCSRDSSADGLRHPMISLGQVFCGVNTLISASWDIQIPYLLVEAQPGHRLLFQHSVLAR